MNNYFPGKQDHETVITWVHKHWIVYLRFYVGFAIFGLGIAVLFAYLAGSFGRGMYLFAVLWLMMAWFWMFMRFLDEEFDVLILTNVRVVDITQHGLFKITFSETSLDLIQDVRDHKTGLLGNILNYGDVQAQTAASSIVFEFDHLGDPSHVARLIQESKRKYLLKQHVHAVPPPPPPPPF